MAPSDKAHGRTHSLLLLQKLLNLRDGASPLTLILDTLEQPAWPLIDEFTTRAKIAKSKTILFSFTTLRKPEDVDVLVPAWTSDNLDSLRKTVLSHCPPAPTAPPSSSPSSKQAARPPKTLIIIDSLNMLLASHNVQIAHFLPSLITTPHTSLIVIHHTDVPIFGAATDPDNFNEYAPSPLAVVQHLATAVVTMFSLSQEIARQKARDRSVPEPLFGLNERKPGVLVGLRRHDEDDEVKRGVVLEVDIRRRSGRSVVEKFVVVSSPEEGGLAKLWLMSDYGIFAKRGDDRVAGGQDEGPESTFDLGLTEKQRRDREGVVLPYFDAQTDIGGGEGGRILYDMGREDDFDDSDDEI